MDNKKNQPPKEIQIELTPDVASGHYANLAAIAHTPGEFFLDFIALTPNVPKAKVATRVIMTPENVKNLLYVLRDNIQKYESTFGTIQPKIPLNGNTPKGGDIPNPFMA